MTEKTVGVWIFEDNFDVVNNAKIQYTLTGRTDSFDNYEAEMTMSEYYRYNDVINTMGN